MQTVLYRSATKAAVTCHAKAQRSSVAVRAAAQETPADLSNGFECELKQRQCASFPPPLLWQSKAIQLCSLLAAPYCAFHDRLQAATVHDALGIPGLRTFSGASSNAVPAPAASHWLITALFLCCCCIADAKTLPGISQP